MLLSNSKAPAFRRGESQFTLFEIGRVEYMRERGIAYKQMGQEDGGRQPHRCCRASCRYRQPARYDDLLRIRTRVSESRRRSVRFAYEILGRGEVLATGETLHAICNRQGRQAAIPVEDQKYR
jgi:acyl-CoA thioester hydrolase